MSAVKIVEVGPRDGLQNESMFIPTELKVRFIENLKLAGLKNIEITSFVSPKAVEQMKDASLVASSLDLSSFNATVLIPNLKGLNFSKDQSFNEVCIFTTTSEAFSQKNTKCTIAQTYKRIEDIFKNIEKGQKVRGYLSTVFGCPYEGEISIDKVLYGVEKLFSMGCYEVALGDTTGVGLPEQVKKILNKLKEHFDVSTIAMHVHDTYGMGLVNVHSSYEEGVRIFDSSAGGLGGCPYAKGASGNLATEDLCHYLKGIGIETSIDLVSLVKASKEIFDFLGKQSMSKVNQYIVRTHGL